MADKRFRAKAKGPVRPKLAEPQTSASLMEQVLGRLGGQGRVLEHRVFDAYTGAVGEMLGSRTAPETLRGTTLLVRVESSALAHELSMLKGEILTKLTAALGPGLVTDLRTRVGAIGPLREGRR